MKELIGKKITKLFVEKDHQDALVFEFGDERIVYNAYGDCCSETWFADITGVKALLGETVHYVEEVECDEMFYPKDDGRGRQECEQYYGMKLTTNKGCIDIIYRNSSNGYYGGSCELGKKLPEKMVEITDDWSA